MMLGMIAYVFRLGGRGVGVMFASSPPLSLAGRRVVIAVIRPDGFAERFHASCELARVAAAPGGEVLALVVFDATVDALVPGSTVTLIGEAGSAAQ